MISSHRARIFKIQNPKHEIRNKSEMLMMKIQNALSADTPRPPMGVDCTLRPSAFVSDIQILGFEFVSDFEFRISNLALAAGPR
jgi:hypothetical protein